jgi:DEAD/DEAH box helicase domain-containing protein
MRRGVAAPGGLRGAGDAPVLVVEEATGRLVGTVDEPSAQIMVHDGAVYLHQGDSYLVSRLDLADRVALVEPGDPGYTTTARDVTEVEVRGELRRTTLGAGEVIFGDVQVRRQVVGYTRRRADTGAPLGDTPLDLPPRHLNTRAVWWTLSDECRDLLTEAGIELAGAAHAIEHAAIGLLPLFATCDRWDIGGVSYPAYPDTGEATIFIYDGHRGGVGVAEKGYEVLDELLRRTLDAIHSCPCESGCPSCIQSPKCGNLNTPLDKRTAVLVLRRLLETASLRSSMPRTAS